MISETAANMVVSLQHCLTLFHQQEDIRVTQLKQEKVIEKSSLTTIHKVLLRKWYFYFQEKCRVLEESLNVLAKEHHHLEQSVASHFSNKTTQFLHTDDDEYHDAFNNEDGKFV